MREDGADANGCEEDDGGGSCQGRLHFSWSRVS
jgi:hypothetical protein